MTVSKVQIIKTCNSTLGNLNNFPSNLSRTFSQKEMKSTISMLAISRDLQKHQNIELLHTSFFSVYCNKIIRGLESVITFLMKCFGINKIQWNLLGQNLFHFTIKRKHSEVPKAIDDYWNNIIQFDWVSAEKDPSIANTCKIGHTLSDLLANACKQERLQDCRFSRILADDKRTAWGVWFSPEKGYHQYDYPKRALSGEFNNNQTLLITTIANWDGKQPSQDLLKQNAIELNKQEMYGCLKNAEFYFLTLDDLADLQSGYLPEHLKEFLKP